MAATRRLDPTRPGPAASHPSLLRAQWRQLLGLLLLIAALVLLIAPWITGYPDSAEDAHRNELAVGIVLLLLAVARFTRDRGKWPRAGRPSGGCLDDRRPVSAQPAKTKVFDGAQILDVVVGIVLVVLACLSLIMLGQARRQTASERAPESVDATEDHV